MEFLGSLPGSTATALTEPLAANNSANSPWGTVILFAALIGLLYVVFLRPQRHRMRKAAELSRDLAPGQQVMTAGGLYGTIAAIEDDAVIIEVAPGVPTRWAKQAIARVVPPPEAVGLDEAGGQVSSDPYEARHDIDLVDPEPPPSERRDDEPGR